MRLLALLVSLSLAGCAAPPPAARTATRAEQEEVLRPYIACLQGRARNADDGTSDAMTIARAIYGGCLSEWERVFASMAQGNNNAVVRMMRSDSDKLRINVALQSVLTVRNQKKQP